MAQLLEEPLLLKTQTHVIQGQSLQQDTYISVTWNKYKNIWNRQVMLNSEN